jgi:hypothetical protein
MLYLVIEGQVAISKEIHYSIRNRYTACLFDRNLGVAGQYRSTSGNA